MIGAARRPLDGNFRSWSDGRRVHLLVRFTGGNLGRGPITMHATTELVPAREAVIGYYRDRDADIAGDPVHVEALATRVGLFSAFRKIGRAAKGAAMFATAPVRALGGAGINAWKTTTNLAKGLEGTTALTTFATKPLTWRPGRKKGGPPKAGPGAPPDPESTPEAEEEYAMSDETSGSPRPQAKHIRSAHHLLRRAQSEPGAARHVKNIATAAAKGHPGAQLAQAAIKEARKQQRPPTPLPVFPAPHRWGAFSSWAKGAA
jgi:hypothetical protein